MQTKTKSIIAAIAAAAFMTAAYYLPAETFLAAFAGGLFLDTGIYLCVHDAISSKRLRTT